MRETLSWGFANNKGTDQRLCNSLIGTFLRGKIQFSSSVVSTANPTSS